MPTRSSPSLTAPLRDWALWYITQGCRVFPLHTPTATGCSCPDTSCPDPGKHPRIKNWQNEASADPTQVAKWWDMWPHANIGWLQGITTWALDIDPHDGGMLTLEALIDEYGPLPLTPVSHTGSGGCHYLFAADSAVGNKVKFLPGFDTRSTGGYIAAPPSLHASGRQYVWNADHDLETCTPVPAPDWLLSLVCSTRPSHPSSPDGPIEESGRNNTLSRMAYAMRTSGMGIDEILIALTAVNARCVPPLDTSELEKIAKGKAQILPDPAFVFHTNGTNGTAAPQGTATQKQWSSHLWEELVATRYPLRQWLINGLIPHGLTIVGGPPKSRKSTLLYEITLATVGQGLALNYWGCQPGGALYCSCEDEAGDTKTLVTNLRPQMPDTLPYPLRFANCDEVPTLSEGLLDYVREQVKQYQLSLVVLDPLMYLLDQTIPRGMDPFLAMKRMLLPFHWLASELKFALVFVDHTRKASVQDPDVFTTLYGSQAKQAVAYTLIMVSREGDELTLDTKGRGAGEHKFLFTCKQAQTTQTITWTFGGADNTILSGSRQQLVLQAFANARAAGVFELGPRDVIDYAELQQSTTIYNNIRQALFKLRRKQVLHQMKSGLFAVANPDILPQPTPVDDDPGVRIS